jgi:hypothetical protein
MTTAPAKPSDPLPAEQHALLLRLAKVASRGHGIDARHLVGLIASGLARFDRSRGGYYEITGAGRHFIAMTKHA